MPIPMGQICLQGDCKKSAEIEKEGNYYCRECYDIFTTIIDDTPMINILQDAIAQINYLSRKLSAKQFDFTRPTTNKTIDRINDTINKLKEKN